MAGTTVSVDMFLDVIGVKSGKIKGESQDSEHKGEIDIETARSPLKTICDTRRQPGPG